MARPRLVPIDSPWHEAFRKWREDHDISTTWLAYQAKVTAVAVHYWQTRAYPTVKHRLLIERLSDGAVRADLAGPEAKVIALHRKRRAARAG